MKLPYLRQRMALCPAATASRGAERSCKQAVADDRSPRCRHSSRTSSLRSRGAEKSMRKAHATIRHSCMSTPGDRFFVADRGRRQRASSSRRRGGYRSRAHRGMARVPAPCRAHRSGAPGDDASVPGQHRCPIGKRTQDACVGAVELAIMGNRIGGLTCLDDRETSPPRALSSTIRIELGGVLTAQTKGLTARDSALRRRSTFSSSFTTFRLARRRTDSSSQLPSERHKPAPSASDIVGTIRRKYLDRMLIFGRRLFEALSAGGTSSATHHPVS